MTEATEAKRQTVMNQSAIGTKMPEDDANAIVFISVWKVTGHSSQELLCYITQQNTIFPNLLGD